MANVLIVSYVELFPVNAGNRRRIVDMIEVLKQSGYNVYYLFFNQSVNRVIKRKTEAALGKDKCFFYAGDYGYKRRRLRRFKTNESIYYSVDEMIPKGLYGYVKELQKKMKFDAVIAEYVMASKLLNVFDDSTLKIIDTHDILTGRNKIFEQLGMKPTGIYLKKNEEIKGLKRADAVLAIQSREAAILRKWLPESIKVAMVGNSIKAEKLEVKYSRKILFVGSGNRLNQDGAKWFVESVLPLIKNYNIEVLFAGKVCEGIADSTDYKKLGFVDDLRALYKEAQIVINPVRGGTGLNIKTIEALGYARPLISTSVGAKGLPNANQYMRVADTSHAFAESIVELIDDIDECRMLSERAYDFATKYNRICKEKLLKVMRSK